MKKLAEPMDYVLMDATTENGKGLTEYNCCVPASGLMVPSKCYKKDDPDDDDLLCMSSSKSSKYWKKYKKSNEFVETVFAIFHGFADCDGKKNFFIVLKNKDYKHFGKKIKKAMYGAIGIDEDKLECIYLYDEMDKKDLSRELSGKKLDRLIKIVKEFGKEFTKKKHGKHKF